jgi:hypothetical protein
MLCLKYIVLTVSDAMNRNFRQWIDWLWGVTTELLYPTDHGIKQPGREADHSLPSSSEDKNVHVFMTWCLINYAQGQLHLLLKFILPSALCLQVSCSKLDFAIK